MMRKLLRTYTEDLWLKQPRSLGENTLLTLCQSAMPRWRKYAAARVHKLSHQSRIQILCCADGHPDDFRRLQFGDTWVKYELTKVLGQMGYMVTHRQPHAVVHLYGMEQPLPKDVFSILWIYSHPDRVTPELLKKYDKIFCLSASMAKRIEQMGFEAEVMWGATSRTPPPACLPENDVVFVGNARQNGHRDIVDILTGQQVNLKVWGAHYKNLPDGVLQGPYMDYPELRQLYAAARITLNDHWPDRRQAGFVAVRVFDILASGGFCISDANPGIDEIFGDTVPQYHNHEELIKLVHYYLKHEDERRERSRRGGEIARQHTWTARAARFAECAHKAGALPEPAS